MAVSARLAARKDGRLEAIVKDKTVVLKAHVKDKYMGKYFNYGRNFGKIKFKDSYVTCLGENGNLLAIKVNPASTGYFIPDLWEKNHFSSKLDLSSPVQVSNIQGCPSPTEVFTLEGSYIYCLSACGLLTCGELQEQPQRAQSDTPSFLSFSTQCQKQLHMPTASTFTCMTALHNMIVAISYSAESQTSSFTLLDANLSVKSEVRVGSCDRPVHAAVLSLRGFVPVLMAISATGSLLVFTVVGGQLLQEKCKFESLRELDMHYREQSPLSFSSPFVRPRIGIESPSPR